MAEPHGTESPITLERVGFARGRFRGSVYLLAGVTPPGSPPQVRQYGEHAPVILGSRRQAELGEDARDVLLDGAQRDHEPLRDRLVRAALRHQLEHLALARRELVERIVAAAAA